MPGPAAFATAAPADVRTAGQGGGILPFQLRRDSGDAAPPAPQPVLPLGQSQAAQKPAVLRAEEGGKVLGGRSAAPGMDEVPADDQPRFPAQGAEGLSGGPGVQNLLRGGKGPDSPPGLRGEGEGGKGRELRGTGAGVLDLQGQVLRPQPAPHNGGIQRVVQGVVEGEDIRYAAVLRRPPQRQLLPDAQPVGKSPLEVIKRLGGEGLHPPIGAALGQNVQVAAAPGGKFRLLAAPGAKRLHSRREIQRRLLGGAQLRQGGGAAVEFFVDSGLDVGVERAEHWAAGTLHPDGADLKNFVEGIAVIAAIPLQV